MAVDSEYAAEYEQLLRILVDRTPRARRDYRTVEDVPELSNEEAVLICKHNACMGAEGLGYAEDQALDTMSVIDHEDDRFQLLIAAFAAAAFAGVRKRAAESILRDIRRTAADMADEDMEDRREPIHDSMRAL
jgi:hypothetical protein